MQLREFDNRPNDATTGRPLSAVSPATARSAVWAGYAACAWAFVFAALSFYWAAGGTAGVNTNAPAVTKPVLARDPNLDRDPVGHRRPEGPRRTARACARAAMGSGAPPLAAAHRRVDGGGDHRRVRGRAEPHPARADGCWCHCCSQRVGRDLRPLASLPLGSVVVGRGNPPLHRSVALQPPVEVGASGRGVSRPCASADGTAIHFGPVIEQETHSGGETA